MNKKGLSAVIDKFYKSILINKKFMFKDVNNRTEYDCFPNWRCDSTSEILKKFLSEEYGLEFNYRKSEYNYWSFHIYLLNDEYLIDITASQFNNNNTFPEFWWEKFSKILVLEWKDIKNYTFEKKNVSLTNAYKETFILSQSYLDFYEKLLTSYRSL